MSGSLPPLNFRITATDAGVGKTLDVVNRRVNDVSKTAVKFGDNLKKLGDTSGISRISESFKGLSSGALDTFRSIDRIVPSLSLLTGAASLAGVSALVTRFADLGQKTLQLSQRLSMPVNQLSGLTGAAKLAGVGAAEASAGFSGLYTSLHGAAYGMSGVAAATFKRIRVEFGDMAKGPRDLTDVLYDTADAIKRLYDSGKAGQGSALKVAQNLGIESLYPMLIKGSAGIKEFVKETGNLGGIISPEMAKRADDLKTSFGGLEIAIDGVGNRLGDN